MIIEEKLNWYTASEYAKKVDESRQTIYSRMNYGHYGLIKVNGARLIDVDTKNDVEYKDLYTVSALAKKLNTSPPEIIRRVFASKLKMIEVTGNKLIEYKDSN